MYTLTPELQRYLKIVDPYMTLDELAVAFKVCMTVMIRLRKDMNLDPKPKGRPKNREAIIINGIIYPEHVQEAITKIITLRTREEKALNKRRSRRKIKKQKRLETIKQIRSTIVKEL